MQLPDPDPNRSPDTPLSSTEVLRHIVGLKSRNSGVRSWAAIVLGQIGDATAVEPLCAALEDKEVRPWAVKALLHIGEASVLPLCAMLTSARSDTRIIAAFVLGKIGDTKAVEPLCATLEDEEDRVRSASAEALGQIGDLRAVKPLCAALKDEEGEVRLYAGNALVKIGEPSVLALCVELIAVSRDTRTAAALALGQIRDVRAVEPLCYALQNEYVRPSATIALRQIGNDKVLPLRVLSSPHLMPAQRLKTLEALTGAWSLFVATEFPYRIGDVRKFCENLCRQVDTQESVKRGAEEVLTELRNRADAKTLLRAGVRNEPHEVEELLRGASGQSKQTAPGELLRSSDASSEPPQPEQPGKLSRIFKRR